MGDFAFNAPQYIDFTSPTALELKEFGDDYFGNYSIVYSYLLFSYSFQHVLSGISLNIYMFVHTIRKR